MKIGYILHGDFNDEKAWSGTFYNLANTIKKHHSIIPILVKPNKIEKIFNGIAFVVSLGKRKNGILS